MVMYFTACKNTSNNVDLYFIYCEDVYTKRKVFNSYVYRMLLTIVFIVHQIIGIWINWAVLDEQMNCSCIKRYASTYPWCWCITQNQSSTTYYHNTYDRYAVVNNLRKYDYNLSDLWNIFFSLFSPVHVWKKEEYRTHRATIQSHIAGWSIDRINILFIVNYCSA